MKNASFVSVTHRVDTEYYWLLTVFAEVDII